MAGFSKIGLAPDAGLTSVISDTYTRPRTLEILLLNRKIDSKEALSVGLINKVTDKYLDEARVLAKSFSSMAPLSIKEIKKNIIFSKGRTFESSLERETEIQGLLGATEDYSEGVKAFF
jgi:2-(1,2-epoxy-1,2-dihydrophenyl)acetyl-CoA isomerase